MSCSQFRSAVAARSLTATLWVRASIGSRSWVVAFADDVLGSACSSLVPPPTSRSLPTSSSACYCCATASAAWVPLQATALGRGTIRAKSWCRRQLAAHACIRCRRPGWLDAQADPILADPFSLEAHCYASAAAAAALPSHSQSKVLGPKMPIPSCESLAPRQN